MRLMWTLVILWNHMADGFDHKKLEHVSDCKSGPKNLKALKSESRKVLIY